MPKLYSIALLLAVSLVACGDSTGSSFPTGCKTSNVQITVSPGLTPRFEWTPDCAVWDLSVYRTDGVYPNGTPRRNKVWETFTLFRNELSPPLIYGVHPPGAEAPYGQGPALPLEAGGSYEVVLSVTSNDLTPSRVAGRESFSP